MDSRPLSQTSQNVQWVVCGGRARDGMVGLVQDNQPAHLVGDARRYEVIRQDRSHRYT